MNNISAVFLPQRSLNQGHMIVTPPVTSVVTILPKVTSSESQYSMAHLCSPKISSEISSLPALPESNTRNQVDIVNTSVISETAVQIKRQPDEPQVNCVCFRRICNLNISLTRKAELFSLKMEHMLKFSAMVQKMR